MIKKFDTFKINEELDTRIHEGPEKGNQKLHITSERPNAMPAPQKRQPFIPTGVNTDNELTQEEKELILKAINFYSKNEGYKFRNAEIVDSIVNKFNIGDYSEY